MKFLLFYLKIIDCFQEDDEVGDNYGKGQECIYLERFEVVYKVYMQKLDEYEEIYNNYVQCEQVSLFFFYFIMKFVFVCCCFFNNFNDVK